MTDLEDLQPLYDKAYRLSENETLEFVKEYLHNDRIQTFQSLAFELRPLISRQLQLITSKRHPTQDFYRTDPFTADLVQTYDNEIGQIKNRNISAFIHIHLPKVKTRNLTDVIHEYENHKLPAHKLVGLLARYIAIRNILNKMYKVVVNEDETSESYIGKLRTENTSEIGSISDKAQESTIGIELSENPYPRIFKNLQCYLFFQRLQQNVRPRYELADYSFIYRRMQKEGYIHKFVTDSEFRHFLEAFNIEIDKTKLLAYCTTDMKEKNFNMTKSLFKLD